MWILTNSLKITAVLFLASMFIIVLDSDLRSNIRSLMKPSSRTVLAVAKADLELNGNMNEVLKIKTGDKLSLEVYSIRGNEKLGTHQQLIASIDLPDHKDGYFTFNGEVTNLAIDDIDNDKRPEILATTFDNDLVAHLNVYRYIPGQKELHLVKLR